MEYQNTDHTFAVCAYKESPYLECMGAADRIHQLLAAGCRCRDITVVCTDMTVYQPLVNLVFHRLHIPVYQSGTEDILQKSVIATVLMALDAALSGFDQKSVLRYLRSALSPVDPDTCDRIENYAIIWGIRGQKWTQSWESHPDGLSGVWTEEDQHRLEELNTARELAIAPLTRLWQGFRDASDLRGQILALYGFLEDISLEMRLSRMAQELDAAGDNRAAQILNQLWEILLGALEQMYDMLGDTHWEGEQFIRLFRLLLSQYDVGTIPPVLDAVQVGPVSAMRCHQEKHLIVLGAEEGKLPGYSGSAGVLTDQERVTLRELGDSSSRWDSAADTLESTDLIDSQEMKDLVPFNHLRNSRADSGLTYWQNSGFTVDADNGVSGTASFKCEGALNTTKSLSQTITPANRQCYTFSAQIASENLSKGTNGQVGIEVTFEYEDGTTETRFIDLI